MMGSGIYSTTGTHEMVCKEMVEDSTCDAIWFEDFQTDDRGHIDQEVVCPKCKSEFWFTEE